MSKAEINKLKFVVALVAEFAQTYKIKQRQAFNYLYRFRGMQFLEQHYNYMHTQDFGDVIEDLAVVCRRNGGQLV